MQIINYTEKDAFDILIDYIDVLDKEKYLSLGSIMVINDALKNHSELSWVTDTLTNHYKDSIDTINKEEDICKKMLHYIKLMIFNDKEEYYTDSYYYDYFNEILNTLKINSHNRRVKTMLLANAIKLGIKHHSKNITIMGNMDAIENIITDDVYNNIMNKIPKR